MKPTLRDGREVPVLLVDDRAENLLALEAILHGRGYSLVRARSGEAALDAVLQRDFALVLMDVSMPGMDGFETATLIKQRPRCQAVPIIFVTASIYDLEHIYRGYAVGAVDYLYKPISPEVVRAKVAVFAELFCQREQIRHQASALQEASRREREILAVRAETALSQSEAQYEATTREAPFGIALIDESGRWLRVNRSLCQILGRAHAELPPLPALLCDQEAQGAAPALAAVLGGQVPSYCGELPLLHASGKRVWASATLSRLSDARGSHLAVVLEDITERKLGETFQAFLSQASEVLLSALDYRNTLPQVARLAVPQLADWCAIDIVQADGRRTAELTLAHRDPERRSRVQALRRRLRWEVEPRGAAGAQPLLVGQVDAAFCRSRHIDLAALGPLRDELPCSVLRVPMLAHGEVLGSITLASETPTLRYRAAHLRLAEDLAHRCAFAVDNTRLYESSQAAICARDEFLTVASHELRTPLTPLRLQLQRLTGTRTRPPANLPRERVHDILLRSERHVQRLGSLIDNLLDVSRITAGRLTLETDRVDLSELTQQVAGRFSEELLNAGSELSVRTTAAAVGQWDRARLEQVVANLLTNAIKYGNGGPIEMVVGRRGGGALLEVRDHGIGIAADKQASIFERFERAVSARAYGGLGLGLFIARQILDAHGGSIQVDSSLGIGSVFTVELPAEQGATIS